MKRLQGISILIVLIFLFFLPSILKPNSIYAPVDMIYLAKPWSEYKNTIPHNVLQGDGVLMFIPFRSYYYDQMHERRFPLWNPYIYGGAPFFANDQSGVLSLYNLMSLPFSFEKGFLIIALLKLLITGIGMYLLLDLLGLGLYASLFGSITWVFSAYMIMYSHLLTSTAAGSFIPWSFYFFERLFRSMDEQPKSNFLNVAGISTAIGMSFLAGHAETTAVGVLGLILYAVVKLALSGKHLIKGIFYTGSGIMLGTLIAAVQLFPFVQILLNSEPLLFRTVAPERSIFLSLYSMVMMWFAPYINTDASYSYLFDHYINRGTFAYAYIGMAPLLMGMYALFHVKKIGKTAAPFIVTAVIALCFTENVPPFSWLFKLPLLAAGSGWYYLLMDFSLSVLAGFGVQNILTTEVKDSDAKGLPIAGTTVVFLSLIILYLFLTIIHVNLIALLLAGAGYAKLLPLLGHNPGVIALLIVESAIALFFIAGTVFLLIKAKRKPKIAVISLILLALADLFTFGINYNPDPPAHDLKPTTPLIQKLKELTTSDYTFYAGDDIIAPNLNMNYGIRAFGGYDITVSLLYQKFLFLLFPGSTPLLGSNGSSLQSRPGIPPDHVIASIAGIKYLIFTSSTYLNPAHYKLLGTYKDLSLWENPDAKPLFYLADSVQSVMSDDEARALLSTHDPKLIHISLVTGIDETGSLNNAKIRLTGVKDVPDEHEVKVEAGTHGFLVINEPYYPGWHAYIDGKEVQMYHVNYLFQGIKLPAGNYTVTVIYNPGMFRLGLIVSAVTIGLMMGMVVITIL